MANPTEEKGVCLEVLGTCMTNTTPDSQHDAKVEYKHLWSYAQEAALVAVSEKNPKTQCYEIIADPERRAKRIAAHYADLYFESAEKTKGKLEFYWPALAAFVVKDIVEAFRFARVEVLHREWNSTAGAVRNNPMADLGSLFMTDESPYQHALRTYSALAKGNIWLFMDIYPWFWFFLKFGINPDGTLNQQRLSAAPAERNWSTFQKESKAAVNELPYSPNWSTRLASRLANDPVYKKAGTYFDVQPSWDPGGGYGQHTANAAMAHHYVRAHVKEYDNGYRTPLSCYWGKFGDAYFVMEAEHIEMTRIAADGAAIAAVVQTRAFTVKSEVTKMYQALSAGFAAPQTKKSAFQLAELVTVARQEQINVLQPLIYNDPYLKRTMDLNHRFSRMTGGWLSPQFKVIYFGKPLKGDTVTETVFDPPTGTMNQLFGARKSLPDQDDRMAFVKRIAEDFDYLMLNKRSRMNAELAKIRAWKDA